MTHCPPGHHTWIAGMMYVNDEDVEAVAAVRTVECETCERVYRNGDEEPQD